MTDEVADPTPGRETNPLHGENGTVGQPPQTVETVEVVDGGLRDLMNDPLGLTLVDPATLQDRADEASALGTGEDQESDPDYGVG